jgi:hypothetical protein
MQERLENETPDGGRTIRVWDVYIEEAITSQETPFC